MTCDFVNQQCADKNQNNAYEVHQGTNPGCICEECTCEQRDYGQLCTTGHEGCQHCCYSAFSFVSDGTRRHNTGDCTAGTDNEGNDGFTGQTNLFEDGVQNHGYTRHVAAVLQERHQEIHYHYQRQEADNGTNTADDTICYQCLHEGRCAGKLICNEALEGLNPTCQNICQIGPQLRLGDIEYQEHNHNED